MDRELIENMKSSRVGLHEADRVLDADSAILSRRAAVSELTGTEFKHITNYSFNTKDVTKRNIENMIGAVQIPLGVAGPLHIMGEHAIGDFYVPLATTEGALVASINRGCSVITACGGANVRIFKDEMTRAPVFKVDGAIGAKELVDWVNDPVNFKRLKEKAETTTKFGKLISVYTFIAGRNVYVRFSYDTKDAMGMNMVTIATDAAVDLIISETSAELVALSGNMCSDKKPAAINVITGKGKTVSADVVLDTKTILEKLKTTPEKMVDVNYRKNLVGSALSGSLGMNAHAANVASAMFIACGQDAAHAVEASNTMTTLELTDEGLHCSVTLPSLAVGTVGGGTGIGAQKECLEMLGAAGAGTPPGTNSKKFAEIIAAAVLAGEISLIGALAARHLAKAHSEHGR